MIDNIALLTEKFPTYIHILPLLVQKELPKDRYCELAFSLSKVPLEFRTNRGLVRFFNKFSSDLKRLRLSPQFMMSGWVKSIASDGSFEKNNLFEAMQSLYQWFGQNKEEFRNHAFDLLENCISEDCDTASTEQLINWLLEKKYLDIISKVSLGNASVDSIEKLISIGIETHNKQLVEKALFSPLGIGGSILGMFHGILQKSLNYPNSEIFTTLFLFFRHSFFNYILLSNESSAPILLQAINNRAIENQHCRDELLKSIQEMINSGIDRDNSLYTRVNNKNENALLAAINNQDLEVIQLLVKDPVMSYKAYLMKDTSGTNALLKALSLPAENPIKKAILECYVTIEKNIVEADKNLIIAVKKLDTEYRNDFLEIYFELNPSKFYLLDHKNINLLRHAIYEQEDAVCLYLLRHKLMKPKNIFEEDNESFATDLIGQMISYKKIDLLREVFKSSHFDRSLFVRKVTKYFEKIYEDNPELNNLLLQQIPDINKGLLEKILFIAAMNNNISLMTFILNHPLMDQTFFTPKNYFNISLVSATVCNHNESSEGLELLLDHQLFKLDYLKLNDNVGRNILMFAAFYSNISSIKVLLQRNLITKEMFEALDNNNDNVFMHAVCRKRDAGPYFILKKNPYFKEGMLLNMNKDGMNILFEAARRGNFIVVEDILKRHTDIAKQLINSTDKDSFTILHHLVFGLYSSSDKLKMLSLLLDSKLIEPSLFEIKAHYEKHNYTISEFARHVGADFLDDQLNNFIELLPESESEAQTKVSTLSVFAHNQEQNGNLNQNHEVSVNSM